MTEVIDDDFLVCTDCIMAIANDDYSGLDYHLDSQDAVEKRIAEIQNGMRAAGGTICPGDFDRNEEFSHRDCDCCGSPLAGTRHHCVVLS